MLRREHESEQSPPPPPFSISPPRPVPILKPLVPFVGGPGPFAIVVLTEPGYTDLTEPLLPPPNQVARAGITATVRDAGRGRVGGGG